MNKLQKLNTNLNIFVSLNPSVLPSREKIFKKIYYEHPLFDLNTFENQKKITAIQGIKNIWFCGAYLGYGFHEDGITSALHVVKRILKKNDEKNSDFLSESDKRNIKKMINKLSVKEIISIINKDRKIPKKIIYNYCIEIKNEI